MKSGYWILGVLVMTSPCWAAVDANSPEVILKKKMDAVFEVLQNKTLTLDQRDEQITKIVSPMFDFDLMAKLTLGRKHLGQFSPEQFTQFENLFIKRLKDSYRDKLTLYTDERVVFKKSITGKNTRQIPTEVVSKDNKVEIIYKFRQKDEIWKIYDVEIQGVSIVSTYRAQFDDALSQGTIEDLLKQLAQPVDKEKPQS